MRRAIVVGDSGQDGRFIWNQLSASGFSLIGISSSGLRLHLAESKEFVDIANAESVLRLVRDFGPEQIYYLAAHHHSSQDQIVDEGGLWLSSWTVHVQAFKHFLDAVTHSHTQTRIFYASSSRVFGLAETSSQSESTPVRPTCTYGVTKAMGMMLAEYYRRNFGIFVSCGILFNHESPLRRSEFVSQRVANGLVGLKTGDISSLQIGDLNARVDWGYAPDYTRAMQMILDANAADDFVIASGTTHSIREMIEIAADFLELKWEGRIVENPRVLQRRSQYLCGDPSHLMQTTGWQPETSFREMVQIMVRAALMRRNSPDGGTDSCADPGSRN